MKIIYKYAKLPNNKTLINRINDASVILYKKLEDYDVNKNNDISSASDQSEQLYVALAELLSVTYQVQLVFGPVKAA